MLCEQLTHPSKLSSEYDMVCVGWQHSDVNSNGSWAPRRWSHALCPRQLQHLVTSKLFRKHSSC